MLKSTKLYDFCDPDERAEWLDILIALIEYLRSGESKVGFLNRSLEKNMLHKALEDEGEGGGEGDLRGRSGDVVGEIPRLGKGTGKAGGLVVEEVGTLRRSSRKRAAVNLEKEGRDTKVRRKT